GHRHPAGPVPESHRRTGRLHPARAVAAGLGPPAQGHLRPRGRADPLLGTDLDPPPFRRPCTARGRRGPGTHPLLLAELERPGQRARPLGRDSAPLPAGAAGPDPCRDRWHRGGTHYLTAGGPRRDPQLGLPLLLVARLRPDPGSPAPAPPHRGGTALA